MSEDCTFDNLHLSGLKSWPNLKAPGLPSEAPTIAINCTGSLDRLSAQYVEASRAKSSLKAYASDLRHFFSWGGDVPCDPEVVARYIAEHGETLAPATLERRLASISVAHAARGLPSPSKSELARSVLKGVRRKYGTAQKQAKPLLRDELFTLLEAIENNSARSARDRSLLLLGFAGGFRRSETVELNFEDVEQVRQGLVITLRRSKTDPEGKGRKIGIPHGRSRHCPVKALETWLQVAGISGGPIYRPVAKGGHIGSQRLTGHAICHIIRQRMAFAGLDATGFSGHSLRAGFATSAAQAGASALKIRAQTGHSSDAMLSRYIRDGELFTDNAAGVLL